jgi:uncharacterized membrane protein
METKTTEIAGKQNWLDPMANTVQKLVRAAYRLDRTGEVEDALHGKWLGHSLHVAMTDVPIGAWTTAVLLDGLESVTGRNDLSAGADASIGIGLVGAAGAAVTGLTDYQHVNGTARRIGLVHGILNVAAVGLFASSLITRRRGSRGLGKVLSLAGLGVATVSAKLGGDMVYKHGVGVDVPYTDKRRAA